MVNKVAEQIKQDRSNYIYLLAFGKAEDRKEKQTNDALIISVCASVRTWGTIAFRTIFSLKTIYVRHRGESVHLWRGVGGIYECTSMSKMSECFPCFENYSLPLEVSSNSTEIK